MFEISLPNLLLLYLGCAMFLVFAFSAWTAWRQRSIKMTILSDLVFCRGCHITYRRSKPEPSPSISRARKKANKHTNKRLSKCPTCSRVNDSDYGLPTHTV